MKCGIVVFPGSNCDHDIYHILKHIFKLDTEWVWHKEKELGQFDLIVLPGGFSYGDYLRAGAIAKFSPIMKAVVMAASTTCRGVARQARIEEEGRSEFRGQIAGVLAGHVGPGRR